MTIEEKAKKYINNGWWKMNIGGWKARMEEAFLAGYNEAMRWRDPKEKHPEEGQLVLTKMTDNIESVDICRYKYGRFKLYYQNQPSDYTVKSIFREDLTDAIIGWRPIK